MRVTLRVGPLTLETRTRWICFEYEPVNEDRGHVLWLARDPTELDTAGEATEKANPSESMLQSYGHVGKLRMIATSFDVQSKVVPTEGVSS